MIQPQYLFASTVKNGNNLVEITRLVDPSKEKLYLDGHYYKFNTRLISVKVIDSLLDRK